MRSVAAIQLYRCDGLTDLSKRCLARGPSDKLAKLPLHSWLSRVVHTRSTVYLAYTVHPGGDIQLPVASRL